MGGECAPGLLCLKQRPSTQGWYWSDAGASLFISALILLSVVPLVKNTASVLLSGIPAGYATDLRNCFIQVGHHTTDRVGYCASSPTIAPFADRFAGWCNPCVEAARVEAAR